MLPQCTKWQPCLGGTCCGRRARHVADANTLHIQFAHRFEKGARVLRAARVCRGARERRGEAEAPPRNAADRGRAEVLK